VQVVYIHIHFNHIEIPMKKKAFDLQLRHILYSSDQCNLKLNCTNEFKSSTSETRDKNSLSSLDIKHRYFTLSTKIHLR